MNFIYNDILKSLPEVSIFCSVIFLMLVGVVFSNKKLNLVVLLSILTMLFAGYFTLEQSQTSSSYIIHSGMYYNDNFIALSKIILIILSMFVLIAYQGLKVKNNLKVFEMPILLVIAILGMLIMISANDLLVMYLGLELQSLCAYIMVSSNKQSLRSSESAVKYLILGCVSSGILLYGISLIYGFTSTTNYTVINSIHAGGINQNEHNIAIIIAIVFIISGFCFKLSSFPFHLWTAEVYDAAPSIATIVVATLPKIATAIALSRILSDAFISWKIHWQQIIIVVSVLSLFIGSFGAIAQKKIKRMIAFSSISHMGFVLIAIALSSNQSLSSMLLYLLIYSIANVAILIFIFFLQGDNHESLDINIFAGLAKRHPIKALSISILLLSLAGIPPFSGFFAKFYILQEVINSEMFYVAILAVISTVISVFYYLRIIKIMYVDNINENAEIYNSMNFSLKFLITIAVLFSTLYFAIPNQYIKYFYNIN